MPEPDPNYTFSLPPSPWTYQNGSLNPNLEPSNARQRSVSQRRQPAISQGPSSALPPYHPDYNESQANLVYPASDASSSGEEYEEYEDDAFGGRIAGGAVRVRRGSEGYEVKPIDREAVLERFIESRTHEPGRYNYYDPEPDSESDIEDIPDDDPEDGIPLAEKVENWRAIS